MDTKFYQTLQKLFILLLILNAIIMGIIVNFALNSYSSQRSALIELGNAVLQSFEAARPMLFNSQKTQGHNHNILADMFNSKTIKNVIIYLENGEEIFSIHPQRELIKFDFHIGAVVETDDDIILYNSFHQQPMGMGRMHNNNSASSNSTKIFVSLVISKGTLNSLRSSSIISLAVSAIIELLIFFLYFRIQYLVKLYNQSLKKLKNAENEAATGRLSTILAHEIKNPLSSMSGLTSYAIKKCSDDKLKDILNKNLDEIDRLSTIVNDFLAYGRQIELSFTKVSCNKLIERTIELMHHDAIKKNIKLSVACKDFDIDVDENKFLQVFVNLILNAIESSQKDGTINIVINMDTMSITIINDVENHATVDKDKLFEPFYTSKTKGSGLGLSIIKKIVEQHGYKIIIDTIVPFSVTINFKKGNL